MLDDTPTPIIGEEAASHFPAVDPDTIATRYQILKRIGYGGMGVVYKAKDTVLNRIVAVKLLARQYANEEHLKRFQQEARAASKLEHPVIVRSFDFGISENGEAYFVMEYAQGRTLESYLKQKGPLNFLQFVTLFKQVAEAMAHAHNGGIVHRDLKPSNIMVTREGDTMNGLILDFGVAKLHDDSISQVNTKTGQMIGSPRCISPEQIRGLEVDGRSDIYSLGCVMFEALVGEPPFKAESSLKVMEKHLKEPAPSIDFSDHDHPASYKLGRIVNKCLEKDPVDRFRNMIELHDELSTIIELQEELSVEVPGIGVDTREVKRIDKKIVAPMLILLGLIVVSSIYFASTTMQLSSEPREKVKEDPGFIASDLKSVDNVVGENLRHSNTDLTLLRTADKKLLTGVRKLKLSHYTVTEKDMKRLTNCNGIRSLNLGYTGIDDNCINYIFQLSELKELFLFRTPLVDYSKVDQWDKLKHLQYLHMRFCDLNGEAIKQISKCRSLVTLIVSDNEGLGDEDIKVLAKMKYLRMIDLSGTKVTPNGLSIFKNSGKSIRVNSCKNFIGVDLVDLSRKLGVKITQI